MLTQRKEEYAREMTREMGKVLSETRGRCAGGDRYRFLHGGRRAAALWPDDAFRVAEQVRHVRAHAGGRLRHDYAVEFSHGDSLVEAVSCLVCGNTCVIKPAEDTPLSTFNLVQALMDAGLPAGVVNIVTGFGPDAGAPLVSHPDVRAISFTGSSEVGRIVGQTAAANFKPCSLEMGGKNAMIVLEDANLDLALDGAVWGAFGTTGQRCTATSRILLQKRIAAEFTGKLVAQRGGSEGGRRPGRVGGDGAADQPAADGDLDAATARLRERRARGC